MNLLELIPEPASLLVLLLIAAGHVVCRLLPLISKRANTLAVRLERAKAKRTR